jgi:hypothetical protein
MAPKPEKIPRISHNKGHRVDSQRVSAPKVAGYTEHKKMIAAIVVVVIIVVGLIFTFLSPW